jgi:hypothetical protein
MAATFNIIFTGSQPCQLVKNYRRMRDYLGLHHQDLILTTGQEMVPERWLIVNQLTQLTARGNFIKAALIYMKIPNERLNCIHSGQSEQTQISHSIIRKRSLPLPRRWDAGFSARRPRFNQWWPHVRFEVDEVALEQIQIHRFSHANYHRIIAPYSSITDPWCVWYPSFGSTLSYPGCSS